MKVLVLILATLLIICSGNIQNHKPDMNNDDLKNYSYLVSGNILLPIGNGHIQGTGFFIKRDNRLFFVCAKHTLSGCNDKNIKDDRTPNTMDIHVGAKLISIDVRQIKDSALCLPIVLDPDIIAIPINASEIKEDSLSLINDYEDELPENYSEVVIWGFPNNKNELKMFNSKSIAILTNLYVEIDGKPFTDQIHYCVEIKDRDVRGTVEFSGSPVFLKDADSGKFVFIGIMVGVHNSANGLYVVQPKYLYERIN